MSHAAPNWGRTARATVLVVLRHPSLLPVAVAMVFRLAPPRWWRRWPPLPLPDAAYWRFRLVTAYGTADRAPARADVETYLRWCRGSRPGRG